MTHEKNPVENVAGKYRLPERFSGYFQTVGRVADAKIVVAYDTRSQRMPDLANTSRVYLGVNWEGLIKTARIYQSRFPVCDIDFDHASPLFPDSYEPHAHDIVYVGALPRRSSEPRPLTSEEEEEWERLLAEVALLRQERILFPPYIRPEAKNALQKLLYRYTTVESFRKPEVFMKFDFQAAGLRLQYFDHYRAQITLLLEDGREVGYEAQWDSIAEMLDERLPFGRSLGETMKSAPVESINFANPSGYDY